MRVLTLWGPMLLPAAGEAVPTSSRAPQEVWVLACCSLYCCPLAREQAAYGIRPDCSVWLRQRCDANRMTSSSVKPGFTAAVCLLQGLYPHVTTCHTSFKLFLRLPLLHFKSPSVIPWLFFFQLMSVFPFYMISWGLIVVFLFNIMSCEQMFSSFAYSTRHTH